MLRPSTSLSLCALPLLVLGPHLVPEPVVASALGGGNQPPVCVIEYQGQPVTHGSIAVEITPPLTMVDLSGCSSFDPDGGPLTYQWQSCPGTSFTDPTTCDTTLLIPTPHGSSGRCDVRLLLTDQHGTSSPIECRLNIEYFTNSAPTCVLAQDSFTVYADHLDTSVTVTLDACGSFDPDPQQLSFEWKGCPISSFSDATACKTDMTIDLTGQSLPLSCEARLYLSDGLVTTQECRIVVTVLPQPDLDLCSASCPSNISLTKSGVVRAVLVANEYFDMSQVDKTSLFLERSDGQGGQVPFLASARQDISTPSIGHVCDCPIVGPDGHTDLTLLADVPTVVSNLQLFNVPVGTPVEFDVIGELVDGTPFKAQDCMTITP